MYGIPRATWAEADQDRAALAKGAHAPASIPTLAEFAYDQSAGPYGQGLAARTLETNETYRLKFIEGQPLGDLRLDNVTTETMRRFFSELKAEKRRKIQGVVQSSFAPASPRYKHRIKGYFSKLFSLAIEEGWIHANPCRGVKIPVISERDNTILPPEQIGLFLGGSSRIDAIALLCSLCGLRPSEARLLRWDQIDRENLQILSPGSKTQASRRPVPLPIEVLEALDKQPRRADWIFTTQEGRALTKERVRADWNKRKRELGLPDSLRIQDLRGAYVSLLIQSGADVRTTMELARHSNPTMTLKAYARVDDARRRAAQAAVVNSIGVTRGIGGTNKGHNAQNLESA